MKETAGPSEMPVHWTTEHHVPEDTKFSHTVSLAQY